MQKHNVHNSFLFPNGLSPLNEFDVPAEIAMYFGFSPIQTPRIARSDRSDVSHLQSFDKTCFLCSPEEKTSLLRMYTSQKLAQLSHPTMIYYNRARNLSNTRNDCNQQCGLDIIGTHQSVADALAIYTAYALLCEEGYTDLLVDINSIGDRDSLEQFEQALRQFYRSRINELPSKYHSFIKDDVFALLQSDDEICQNINMEAPQAISFLSDTDRGHFMNVLEHLEEVDVPFRINNTIVGNKNISSETVFSIHQNREDIPTPSPLAMGTRYNRLARKIRLGKDINAIGVTLMYNQKRKKRPRKTPLQPKYFFCHLGDIARRRSLQLINELRKARIPVYHSLIRDKIHAQLEYAEQMQLPYVIIMGQKEAMEQSVVVRNMYTRKQETVSIDKLVTYLTNFTK